MIASRCRSDLAPDCTTSPPFGVNGSRKNGFVVTVSTRALNGGRGASVAACAAVAWGYARSHCSCRAPIGQLQRFVPSTSHGAARIMIELRNSFAATSLLAGSPTSRITCSAEPRVLLVQPPRARPRPSPQLRVLPVRKPPSSRSWQLLVLPPWPLRARPCGRLHAPPSPPPRVARVRQPRSSLSQRLRALPASPPRARLFA